MTYTLHQGDCLEVLRTLPDASVDAIVTDPPYGLSFMGKRWDYDVPSVDVWAECLRVLKPGGHLLAFAGTRTQHRMAVRIEDAGFEIRDLIAWVYGSGFPKSLDVSKAIDKLRRRDYVLAALNLGLPIPSNNLHDWTKADHSPGDKWWEEFKSVLSVEQWGEIERQVVGVRATGLGTGNGSTPIIGDGSRDITAPATEAAKQWQGWGTALKPSLEPVTVARKPLDGTVAQNVLAHGTGALNVDGCRVRCGSETGGEKPAYASNHGNAIYGAGMGGGAWENTSGRWPANLIHDGSEEVVGLFPGGEDGGSAARFFYEAKAGGNDDRHAGCSGLFWQGAETVAGWSPIDRSEWERRTVENERARKAQQPPPYRISRGSIHTTVKPTDLMRYLCRLVTPPGGVVLDPFTGSGSTGRGAILEGFRFIGIEREPEYVAIARARIEDAVGTRRAETAQGKLGL